MINPAQADPAHCYADGEGFEKTDAGKPVEFTIHARSKVGAEVPLTELTFKVKVTDPKGKTQKPKVIDRNNGKYGVKSKATCPGVYDVQVLLNGQESADEEFKDIEGSVYHSEITNSIDPKKTTIDGPGVERPNDQEDIVSRPT